MAWFHSLNASRPPAGVVPKYVGWFLSKEGGGEGERERGLHVFHHQEFLFVWFGFLFVCLFLFFLFIYFWLCWVFVSVRGLSPVAASRGHSSSQCAGLSPSRPLLLRSTGSRRADSVVVVHGPSCSAACGIFPDQGSNPCPLHWQADSQPLCHQGSPGLVFRLNLLISFLKANGHLFYIN